jgi:hypothetical protein
LDPGEQAPSPGGQLTIPFVQRLEGPYPNVDAVPTNHVIDRSGKIVYAWAAAFGDKVIAVIQGMSALARDGKTRTDLLAIVEHTLKASPV